MMVIVYHDEIGVVCQEIEPSDECSISFLDGKAYFTSNETDYKIDISLISVCFFLSTSLKMLINSRVSG